MEKLHDYQTVSALEKASHEFDTLIRFTRCSELQTSLWQMFQDSLCRCDDRSIPDDILIRTELYDTLRNILNELDKVIPKSGHAFTISYGPKGVHCPL